MEKVNNKIYIIFGIMLLICIIVVGVFIGNDKTDEIDKEMNVTEVSDNKINENLILNPNKNLFEYEFLVNTYEELKDLQVWYSEEDFYDFKIKAPNGEIYDISNSNITAYEEDTKKVVLSFYDFEPGRWEFSYKEKNIDSDIENFGYNYLIPDCSGTKRFEENNLIFKVISEYGKYDFSYKIIANGEKENGILYMNTLISGEGTVNEEVMVDLTEYLTEYSKEDIIISVVVHIKDNEKEFII